MEREKPTFKKILLRSVAATLLAIGIATTMTSKESDCTGKVDFEDNNNTMVCKRKDGTIIVENKDGEIIELPNVVCRVTQVWIYNGRAIWFGYLDDAGYEFVIQSLDLKTKEMSNPYYYYYPYYYGGYGNNHNECNKK